MPTPAASSTDFANLLGPGMVADPYPVYHRLRAADPVHWHEPFQAWVLTRYDDVLPALHDLRLSSDRAGHIEEIIKHGEFHPLFSLVGKRMNFTDPPQHTRLRRIVSKAFTPHAVAALRPRIQAYVDQLLDRVERQGRMDVIADLAFPLPATVILGLLGVPVEARDRIKAWSDDFMLVLSNNPSTIPVESYAHAAEAAGRLTEHFSRLVAERRKTPQDDLLTILVHAEDEGDRLTEEELYATANVLMVAGHETTTNLIGNGLLALLRHPDELRRLHREPALIPQAIEEMLRYDSPVQLVTRLVHEDMAVGGKTLRQGQLVHLMLGAANRDPQHFTDPDRLDLTRTPDKHLAYGQGIHYCLGAALARLEGHVAFETLLRRMPELRLGAETPEYHENFNLRGLKSLSVLF
jgi:pimeloyl-[acyl-carrier protein] synthase